MKKMCFFLVVCLVLVFSVSVAETVSVDTAIKAIESVLYAEGFDYYVVSYNEKMNNMDIHVAIDGLSSALISLKNAGFGTNLPSWIVIKGNLITLIEDITTYLESIGFADINVVLTVENDDWRIREDYSGEQYSNLFIATTLSLESSSILYDIME